jgi:hypothetical protein
MAIRSTAAYAEEIGGKSRRLILRNGEIERFEVQYAPFGIFALWDQLFGRGAAPQVRHVRDLVALGLVGGGMGDAQADALVASLPPSENPRLRAIAQRLLGVTFLPEALEDVAKKPDGSVPEGGADPILTPPNLMPADTMPDPGS